MRTSLPVDVGKTRVNPNYPLPDSINQIQNNRMNTILQFSRRAAFSWLSAGLVIFLLAGLNPNLTGQTNNFIGGGDGITWDDPANWQLGVPTASHDIAFSFNVSPSLVINTTAVCKSLTLQDGNYGFLITFSSPSQSLTIVEALTLVGSSGTNNSYDRVINVDGASLTCGSLVMTNSSASGRTCDILVPSGSLTVTGNITMGLADRHNIDLGNNGTLNLGGAISGGNLIRGNNSTVNFNGTSAQVLPTGYAYHNVTINNPAGVTLDGNLQHIVMGGNISGNLTVASGILNNGGYSIHLSNAHAFSVANGATFNLSGTSAMVTGAGTISFGSNSTVNYTGSNQNVFAGSYGNLGLSGSGLKSFLGNTSAAGTLTIASGTMALLPNGSTSTANALTMGGLGRPAGSHGSTASAATYESDVFFDSTQDGIVTVATNTCASSSAVLSGDNTICIGGSSNLVVTITGGQSPYTVVYSAGTVNNYMSGDNIPVSPGSTTAYTLVSVTDNIGCTATISGSATVTVLPDAAVTSVSGTTPLCIGAMATYTAQGVVLGGGTGSWSSSDNLIATVNPVTGEVTAVSAGTCDIIFTITGGCNGTPSAMQSLTVLPDAAVTSVSGTSPLCIGATATYTASGVVLGGGTGAWSSSNPAIASVDANTGLVTALTTGTTNIIYTITGGCNGTPSAMQSLTVNTVPSALSYTPSTNSYVEGTAITPLSPSVSGTPPFTFTVNSLPVGLSIDPATGVISGTPTAPTVMHTYTVTATNSCGFTTTTLTITIDAIPFAGGACTLLNNNFSTNPQLANSNMNGAWYPDRYRPASFVSNGSQLVISINAADGAQLRPGSYSGAFYNTQGRKINQCGGCVTMAKADLYIPADWATNKRRSDLWATAYDGSNVISFYPIIGFRNVTGSNPQMSVWNGTGWNELGAPASYNTSYTLEARLNGANLEYLIDNVVVATYPSNGSVYFGDIIMQAYNFNDNTLGVSYDGGPNNSYDAFWDNLVTSNGSGNLVTNTSNGNKYCSIQSAIDDVTTLSGHTLLVSSGTYMEDVNVDVTGLSISGAGAASTTVSGPIGGGGATFQVGASGVTIQGFTITRQGNNLTDWNNPGLNFAGVSVQGQGNNATIQNNIITGNRTGIDINNSNGNNILNNQIDFNRTGLIFRNQTDNTAMTGNFVRDNWTVGVLFLDGSGGTNSPPQTALNSNYNNNNISGNWYGEIVDRQSGGSLPAPGTNIKNFECNWYGAASPVVSTANSSEPGYAAHIPVAYGGTAVNPGGFPDILGPASANFDYINWGVNGTDNDGGTFGWQITPGTCTGNPVEITSISSTPNQYCQNDGTIAVNYSGGTANYTVAWSGASSGSTTGITGTMHTITGLTNGNYTITVTDANGSTDSDMASVGNLPVRNTTTTMYYATIQAAIDAASAGHTIDVCAGTYTESININKALTINGPNVGTPGTGTRAVEAVLLNCTIDINNSGNTTLDGLKVLRTDNGASPIDQIALDGGGTNTVQNCIFERNGSATTNMEIRALTTTTAGGNKVILNNKFTGDASSGLFSNHKTWQRGIYVDQGSFTVNISGNTIENCRTALNVDDYNNNLTIAGNTFNNNGTHISVGGALPSGSYVMGANNFINNPASTMVNLSNVAESFRLNITSSTLNGVSFAALTPAQLFDVEARMAHKDVSTGKRGKVTYVVGNQYVNNFTVPVTKIDIINNSIKYADAPETINLQAGTYNQKVIIDKSNLILQGITNDKTLYVINGSTLVAPNSGITLNTGITNTTIQNLTVQNFTGTNGNSHAGIYGVGGNNNTTVTNVALLNNPTASGFYANGPVNNVSITNSMVTNNGGSARGIVIWNGLKSNITITGNMVTNNTCCGIELQDGDASGVNVSNNTIDVGSGDNAIGLVGLNLSVGANTVSNNTITGGGRFGIEIKNPAGGVTVSNNNVSLTTINADTRDRAGIAVFRRSVTGGNIDVPNGVTITGNTISGYTQTSPEEGFGVVIEGTNHVVSGNTINNCNIGVQEQGGAHPNANYPAGDGNQDFNMSANYFGRGNAPFACGNTIGTNTFSGNGTDTRTVVMNSHGLVSNITSGEYFCNIPAAINDAQTLNGHTITVAAGTYPVPTSSTILVNKSLSLRGANFGTCANGTRSPESKIVVNHSSGFAMTIRSGNVTVDGFEFETQLGRDAINVNTPYVASSLSTMSDFNFSNNIFRSSTTAANKNGIVFGENNLNGNQPSPNDQALNENVTIQCNRFDYTAFANTNRGIVMTTHFDMHTYNNFNISNNEFLLGPNGTGIAGTAVPNRHTMTGFDISDNSFSGGLTGLDLTKVVTPNIENNTFNSFTFKAIGLGSSNAGAVRGNTINGSNAALLSSGSYFGYGIDLYGGTDFGTPANGPTGNNEGLIVENNVLSNFTHPTETAQNFRAVNIRNNPGIGLEIINNAVDNVQNGVLIASAAANTIDINENSFTNAIAAIRNNSAGMTVAGTCNWYGTTSANVVASKNIGNVTFTPYLVNGTDNNIPAIGFQSVPGACTGTPVVITNVTTTPVLCGPTDGDMSVTFSGGTGPYTIAWSGAASGGPVAATSVHTITPLPAGSYTVVVTDNNGSTGTQAVTIDYLPVTNTSDMPNTYYASIQAAIDAATTSNGEILEVCAGTYTEDVVVTKSLDIRGPKYGVAGNDGGRGTGEAIVVPATSQSDAVFMIRANDVSINGFTINGDNTAVNTGWTGTNGADIDAFDGIGMYDAANVVSVSGAKIENNIIENLAYFGVDNFGWYNYNNPATAGHLVKNNLFRNLGTYGTGSGYDFWGGAVLIYNNNYTRIEDNVMTNVRIGVQTGNFSKVNPGLVDYQVITNNTIQARRRGIFHNLAYSNASPLTLSNNTITGLANANETVWDGILLSSLSVGSTTSGNTINGTGISNPSEGIEVWNVKNTSPATISGGTISNVNTGIFLNNYEGYSSDAGDGSHAAISGLTITPNATGVGIRLLDSPSSTTHAKVNASVTGVTISGGVEGIKLEQTTASGAAVGGSFTNNTISASAVGVNVARSTQSATNTLTIDDNDIDLTAQVTGGNPTVGVLLSNITGSDDAIITDNDVTDAFYGYVGYNINTTPLTSISGGSISGVMQGTAFFNTLGGPLAGSTTGVSGVTMNGFTGTSANPANNFHAGVYTFTAGGTTAANGLTLTVDNVTIDGTGAPSQASGGVYLGDFSGGGTNVQNITLTNSSIINNANRGVDARGKVNLTMTGNTLTNNGHTAFGTGGNNGFSVIAQQEATITANNNFITLPATSSTEVHGLITGNGTTNLITAEENSILLNGNTNANSRLALAVGGTGTINAECNWWGTANYQNIQALTNGNVDFINWLINGTDDDGMTSGFQPVAGSCTGSPVVVTVDVNTPATCFTGNNGALDISVSGGTPAFTYNWSNGSTSQDISMLTPGAYTVTVTDSFGSTGTASATVGLLPVENVNTQTGYSTIQAAVAAALPGHVIEVCAGTYTENININKALTINGPNEGISGTGTRFAEAVLLNSTIDINNSGTTIIDGFHVLRTDSTALDQIILDGAGINTIQNCKFERNDLMSIVPGEFARAITTSAGGGAKNVLNNLFTGNGINLFGNHRTWNNAIYVNSGSASVNITGNTFMNTRTAVNLDDYNANVNVSMNTFNNNGTHISFGGSSPTTGNHTLGANDFNVAGSAIINLSNVTTAFRLDMTSSTWIGTSFGALPNATLFAIEAGMYHRGRSGRNGLVTYKANNQYVIAVNPSLQSANDYAPVGGIVNIDAATFNQKLQITKSLTVQGGTNDKTVHIISGTGVVGNTRGIEIASGVTNVTIQNLTVQNFAGTDGNTHGGIYAVGPNNNNLTVNNCLIQNNGAGSGFYANGPINNLTITNNMVNNHGTGARGIVVWNGMKTNINISNNMLTNNRCCGIELQDGAASGVNVSYNTIDIGAGDNAIGLTGLDNTVGANTVNNNTITGGGRFGIEIKNPDGGVTVDGNSVTLTTQDGDLRDRAGIVVMRRGVLNPPNIVNANVPDGVTVTNNTVNNYRQTNGGSSSTGFGIVVEGTNHVVTNNTLNNNDVAIQLQAGHTPYAAPPVSVDGDQGNLADLYFGRGNSPELCNVVHTPNTFSGNTVNSVRIVTGGGTGTIQTDITPTVNDPVDQTVCVDQSTAAVNFTGNYMVGVTYNWVNDNTAIGLAASGSGNIPSFTALNTTNAPIVANVTVTPTANGCTGSSQTFTITVQPRPSISNQVTSPDGYDQTMVSGSNYAHTICHGEELTTSIPTLTSTLSNACGTLRIQTQYISTLPNIPSATLDETFSNIVLAGAQTISPENHTLAVQTITFLTTPYYDVNGNMMYDAGTDVAGQVTQFVLTVQPKPSISNTVTSGVYNQVMTSGGSYAHAICHNTNITTSIPTLNSTLADACGTLRIRTQYISTLPNIPSATLDNTFTNVVAAGPQTISPENNTGMTQTITFITTPYYDVNNNGSFEPAIDIEGDVTTFVLTVHPIPSGAISGTAFVIQNAPTTANVTFTGSVGTAPYTFTYNVNGGGTQTISTIGMNDAITLPHPNGTPGVFTYTLLSVTDANGCAGVVDPLQDTVVITVIASNMLPDLAPSIARPLNGSFVNGQLKEGYVQFSNGGNGPTFGVTKVRLPKTVSNFNLVINQSATMSAGQSVVNNLCTFADLGFAWEITYPTPIAVGTNIKIGYSLTATGFTGSDGTITATILNGTGGDSNNFNNKATRRFVIN